LNVGSKLSYLSRFFFFFFYCPSSALPSNSLSVFLFLKGLLLYGLIILLFFITTSVLISSSFDGTGIDALRSKALFDTAVNDCSLLTVELFGRPKLNIYLLKVVLLLAFVDE